MPYPMLTLPYPCTRRLRQLLSLDELHKYQTAAGNDFIDLKPLITTATFDNFDVDWIDSRIEYQCDEWYINGSLAASSLLLLLAGMTGFVGTLSRLIGPVTVFPLLTLIAVETVDIVVQKASQHWISVVAFIVLMVCVVFLAEINVPIPYWTNGRYTPIQYPLFGQFPYIIAIVSTWLLALVLSLTNTFDENSPARVNTRSNMETIKEASWFSIPHPGAFGGYAVSPGLLLGFIAACIASIAESIGGYGVLAKISQEPYPTSSTLNRSIIMEGLGTLFGGLCGQGVGMTTYSENIAAVSITRVASRFTMQLGGIFLILLGVFSKIGAILATIPDPMIGGVLGVSMAMIIGVAVSNLDLINLKRSRNITIIGIAMILGLGIPAYVIKLETAGKFPSVGVKDIDDTIMMLLKLKMFVGGLIAFILDNLCGGATLRERGFRHLGEDKPAVGADGYSFPASVNRFLLRPHFNLLLRLPFIPSKKELESILKDQENPNNTQTA
uniref:Solute carrier family 23 member 2 n=1 Tax=Panagrellus redivivus TaxID=6233 RepID=A0A7E4V074_PANRE